MADIGGTVPDAWFAVIVLVFAVVAAVFAVLAALPARSEENSGRAEPVLATSVSRPHWLGSHLAIPPVGSAFLVLLTGLGLGLSVSRTLGDSAMVGRTLSAALAHVPAICLTVGVAVGALRALSPGDPTRLGVIAYAGVVGWLGVLLRFPRWALNLSPLGHTPLLPAQGMRWTPLLVMTELPDPRLSGLGAGIPTAN